MWSKPIKQKKPWYPALAITLGVLVFVAGAWFLFGRPNPPLEPTGLEELPSPTAENQAPSAPPLKVSPLPQPTGVQSPTAQTPRHQTAPAQPGEVATHTGILRVSNPTDHPVRVAILAQRPNVVASSTATGAYDLPAHWDFEPGEGATKGLLLSLPNRQIKLRQGDIVIAFAQDGSRQYWGPYVVGETTLPIWNDETGEWQLVLQP